MFGIDAQPAGQHFFGCPGGLRGGVVGRNGRRKVLPLGDGIEGDMIRKLQQFGHFLVAPRRGKGVHLASEAFAAEAGFIHGAGAGAVQRPPPAVSRVPRQPGKDSPGGKALEGQQNTRAAALLHIPQNGGIGGKTRRVNDKTGRGNARGVLKQLQIVHRDMRLCPKLRRRQFEKADFLGKGKPSAWPVNTKWFFWGEGNPLAGAQGDSFPQAPILPQRAFIGKMNNAETQKFSLRQPSPESETETSAKVPLHSREQSAREKGRRRGRKPSPAAVGNRLYGFLGEYTHCQGRP